MVITYLIQQRGNHDCSLASIAMALGYSEWEACWTDVDLEEVVASRGVNDIEPWLLKKGLKRLEHWIEVHTYGDRNHHVAAMLWHRPALVSIASLNERHGGHMVYWDGRTVWDPQSGREGRLALKFLESASISRVVLLNP